MVIGTYSCQILKQKKKKGFICKEIPERIFTWNKTLAFNTSSELRVHMPSTDGLKAMHFLKKFNLSFHSLVQYVTLANLIFSMKPIMLPI